MDPVATNTPPPTTENSIGIRFDKSIKKLIRRKCQLNLLKTIKTEKLTHTDILPSLTPRIKLKFNYNDLISKKEEQLKKIKQHLLDLAIIEAERDVDKINNELKVTYEEMHNSRPRPLFAKLVEDSMTNFSDLQLDCKRRHDKKLDFHRRQNNTTHHIRRREKHISWKQTRRNLMKSRSKLHRQKKRREKHDKTTDKVNNIKKENKVINFSSMDIPDTAYLYLAKGLNFIPSYKGDKLDLKYDALEFIRKLAWKHYFKTNPEASTTEGETNKFKKLKVSSHNYPPTNHPLIEEIKFKILAHIENLEMGDPDPNLTPGEVRGRNWLSKMLKERRLYVTKADKGGAILIFDYSTVVETMERELNDETKYLVKKGDLTKSTVTKLKTLCKKLVKDKYISPQTNTQITGVTEGNIKHGMKQNPEYKAITPYAYPLYKIHSMTEDDFNERKVPPFRLVYAMKFGPMYRMEKWVSCFLTPISLNYCGVEFVTDSDHVQTLLNDININENLNRNDNKYLLYTIDVKALYPSIKPDLAKLALEDALSKEDMDLNTKIAIWKFVDFSFDNAFIFYQKKSFKPIKGIPTGGSISRQIADIFLRWLIFVALKDKIVDWQLIKNWWRYIDDIFGLWKGTEDEFKSFMAKLNSIAEPYGITFDKIQIGTSVNFLDMSVYLSYEDNGDIKINTKLYRKPTDAMRYLDRSSFHAPHTFTAIQISQMLRVTKRNTEQPNRDKSLNELIQGFRDAGYKEEELMRVSNNILGERDEQSAMGGDTLIFSFRYFKECGSTKKFLKSLETDINKLIGEHKMIFANKKGQNLGDVCLKNRRLCIPEVSTQDQRCNQVNCKMCPAMLTSDIVMVNEMVLKLSKNVNCNSENVIYYSECNLCQSNNGYIGRTLQKFNNRGSGHRSCFTPDDYEKSALSMHAMMDHKMDCDMNNFKFAIVKKTHPLNLHREEFIHIEKARTLTLGLNRMQVRH